MDFRILGPLEVWHEGRQVAVAGARQRELLAVLLLHAGEAVSTDRLMDHLWGERQPAAGTTALRVRVSQLRKALGAGGDALVTRPPGYALVVDPDRYDLRRFERGLDEAERALRAGDAEAAREAAEAALALWRGAPLVDFAYAPFAQPAIVRLEELRATALELRVEAELALGRHGRMVAELQALVAENPLRERLWGQLMLALYREGRQAEALATYRAARERLVGEIGIEPGPALQALEARILAQDPALSAPERPAAAAPPPAPRRAVLAIAGGEADGAVGIAERLAAPGAHDLVVAALVAGPDEVGPATARLRELRARARERGVEARVAAFTTDAPGSDAVRLAAEQDAAVLVVGAPADTARSGAVAGDLRAILSAAVCDVVLLAGARADDAPGGGPVLVPFGGHEHDWTAAEIAAWLAGDAPVRLLGARGERGRDASRLLASASLALQRGMGIVTDPVMVDRGPEAVLAASAGAAALVVGLPERWAREGFGRARLEIARRANCPVLLVRGGLRPGGLAPPQALTRFTWSGGG